MAKLARLGFGKLESDLGKLFLQPYINFDDF